jgi:putative methyltransferase
MAGNMGPSQKGALHCLSEEEQQACIRCHTGDEEGTMGFFVCGFIREWETPYSNEDTQRGATSYGEDEDWKGFGDDGDVQSVH